MGVSDDARVYGGATYHCTSAHGPACPARGAVGEHPPSPADDDDLARNPLPGSVFDQFIVEDYLVATLEYRFELFFFLYLHARFTWALIKAPTRQDSPDNRIRLRREQEYSATAAMTSGFLWNSRLLFEYTYDIRGAFRGSEEGHSFMVMISKSF